MPPPIFLSVEEQNDVLAHKYMELVLSVSRKFDGETRHETALRYIREREEQDSKPQGPAQVMKDPVIP